jgi:hypothetical protein
MSIDQKRRQKQLARKAAKRKKILRERRASHGGMDATSMKGLIHLASNSPIHECLVPKGIFDLGIGDVVISRRMPDGSIAVSIFLVDTYCLGVKDCFFRVASRHELESRIAHLREKEALQRVDPEYAVKLIEGAVAYARVIGFDPHKDYAFVKKIFGTIDPSSCSSEFEFGKDGKPFYVSGPHQTEADSQRIINILNERFGPGGIDYMVGGPLGEDLGETEEDEDEDTEPF